MLGNQAQKHFLIYLLFSSAILFSSNGFAFEVIVHDTGPVVNKRLSIKKVEPVYPLATSGDVMCGQSHHAVRFRLNDTHAGLSFSLTARKMTRVKISWDHPDQVFFPTDSKRKTIVFPHSGGVARLYFRSFKPISGNIYIMNDNDVVIRTCPYSFLPAKRYRQSIGVSVNGTQYERFDENLNDESKNVSIHYRISSKSEIPEGGYWSFGVGVSQSEASSESRQFNSNFSYNW